jgi:hypothetical protein
VIVNVRRGSGCLTTGEIVGVALGTVAVGVLIVLGIVLFFRRQTMLFTEKKKNELMLDQRDELSRAAGRPSHAFQATEL